MTVHKVLDAIQEAIKNQHKIPLTGIIVIDSGRLLDLIEKMRTNLPEEIRQAKWITKEGQQIIENAREKADKLVSEIKEKTNFMMSEQELNKDAQIQAKEILRRAREEELNIVKGADEYADEILSRLEEELNKITVILQKSRMKLKEGTVADYDITACDNKTTESVQHNNKTTGAIKEEEYEEEEYEEEEYEEEEYEEEYEEEEYEEEEYEEKQ